MRICKATEQDLPCILGIYEEARAYMRAHGNPTQWEGGYPSEELLRSDIAGGDLYVCREGPEILGVFAYFLGEDPTYGYIEGAWCNDAPYGVIHRIAVKHHRGGIAGACFDYALSRCPELRIDTHKDNIPMQKALAKYGFTHCGTIYLENGDKRLAYQKGISGFR